MRKAVTRIKATDGLLSLEIAYAAASAAMSSDGYRNVENLRRDLRKIQQHVKPN